MEIFLVILGLCVCVSVVLAITANIFYVGSQGLVDFCSALHSMLRCILRAIH